MDSVSDGAGGAPDAPSGWGSDRVPARPRVSCAGGSARYRIDIDQLAIVFDPLNLGKLNDCMRPRTQEGKAPACWPLTLTADVADVHVVVELVAAAAPARVMARDALRDVRRCEVELDVLEERIDLGLFLA